VGEKILLKGKGFGHGIGLCQEGAMEMVGQGKTYNEILKYYFKGSKLSTSDFPINHW
jgi:stage II sporulation protein D